jgi:hypothetical protein
VAGVQWKGCSRAYSWKHLEATQVVHDTLGGSNIALLLWGKGKNLSAWLAPGVVQLIGDSLECGGMRFDLAGRGSSGNLKPVPVYQEYWHSWKEFHPRTSRY